MHHPHRHIEDPTPSVAAALVVVALVVLCLLMLFMALMLGF
jgi:hypothetical protein